MNERLKEFWYQAVIDAKNKSLDSNELIERFGELIVRECVSEIQKQEDGINLDTWDRGFSAGLNAATRVIKRHFGIE